MRTEKVCNGWIIHEDQTIPGYVSAILGVFNNLDHMTGFIKTYYENKLAERSDKQDENI